MNADQQKLDAVYQKIAAILKENDITGIVALATLSTTDGDAKGVEVSIQSVVEASWTVASLQEVKCCEKHGTVSALALNIKPYRHDPQLLANMMKQTGNMFGAFKSALSDMANKCAIAHKAVQQLPKSAESVKQLTNLNPNQHN